MCFLLPSLVIPDEVNALLCAQLETCRRFPGGERVAGRVSGIPAVAVSDAAFCAGMGDITDCKDG